MKKRPKKIEKTGKSRTRAYGVWCTMKGKCDNPNHYSFNNYGGRGITYCDKWKNFSGFFEDMGERPSKLHSIDRIDNDKEYSKENCRWSLASTQMKNRRPFSNQGLKYFNKRRGSVQDRYTVYVPPFKQISSVCLEKALAYLTIRLSSKEHREFLEPV